ncbi:hypothetical protein Acsp03_54620 [Actinomadura sp. NBRC 104412]|uniref:hypothetical protein n=1 Tax=Actinomadura sp. NBRC 104412 TaxID=3032203 RepID=UPI0024A0C48E|nr:hypothetical protein [Actinomadura sp. NBRC 104412]GLZ07996.1 hypothetical protein Acsp03_54620 [Actinomadura sp. NBRC 104412]
MKTVSAGRGHPSFETGHAVICGESGRSLGSFASAEHARRLYARRREVILVWIDGHVPSPDRDAL